MDRRMANYTTLRTDQDVKNAIALFMQRGQAVSTQEIADHLQCHKLTVIRSIKRLQDNGEIHIANIKGKPNRYQLN